MESAPILYLVVPCYNEHEVLPETSERLGNLLKSMVEDGLVGDRSRVIFVDDGSRDDTWNIISRLAEEQACFCGVKLAANSGHQNALMAGLLVAKERADITVSIDADLQDDIHVIPEMVRKYGEGCDIVCGVRKKRVTDTWFKRTTALAFYRLMHALGVKTVYNHADFRLMSRRAVAQLEEYVERNLFLRGIVPLIGYKVGMVYYDRSERTAGESKYPLSKMISFAIDGVTSFSTKPVHMVFFLGLMFLVIAVGILAYVLWEYVTDNVVAGWASVMLSVWFGFGCVLVSLGIIGEYIGKIYIESKHRPRFNIEKTRLN